MGILKHIFKMISFSRELDALEDIPEKGEVFINVTIENPPKLEKFKQKDVAVILATVNIRMKGVAEAIMRGETVYEFEDVSERTLCEKSVAEEQKLPAHIEKKLTNAVGARAILLLVKAQNEIGIPPPVALPQF